MSYLVKSEAISVQTRIVNYDFSENMLLEARKKQKSLIDKSLKIKRSSFICGDIEDLVFANEVFDIVWSTNSLQWCNNLPITFNKIRSILKLEGLFIFSTFGPNTLFELRNITKEISSYQKINDFINMHNIRDILINEGFSNPVIESEEFCLTYNSIDKLFLELKNIGATSGFMIKKNGLTGKSFLNKIVYPKMILYLMHLKLLKMNRKYLQLKLSLVCC